MHRPPSEPEPRYRPIPISRRSLRKTKCHSFDRPTHPGGNFAARCPRYACHPRLVNGYAPTAISCGRRRPRGWPSRRVPPGSPWPAASAGAGQLSPARARPGGPHEAARPAVVLSEMKKRPPAGGGSGGGAGPRPAPLGRRPPARTSAAARRRVGRRARRARRGLASNGWASTAPRKALSSPMPPADHGAAARSSGRLRRGPGRRVPGDSGQLACQQVSDASESSLAQRRDHASACSGVGETLEYSSGRPATILTVSRLTFTTCPTSETMAFGSFAWFGSDRMPDRRSLVN
jgi:hypothetical protein